MDSYMFHDKNYNPKKQLLLACFFTVFTVVALGIDSVFFTKHYFDGRSLTNLLALIYFSLLLYFSESYLKKLMLVMVVLSYIGELLFCKLLGFYNYRTIPIPLYVPFGHAIVYASGYIFAHTSWAIKNENKLQKFFTILFVLLFIMVGIFLNDIFTILLGGLFFLLLKRKRWQNLYYFIALCVVFIELTGTFFQCWRWSPKVLNIIPTANPPIGAVFLYAGGDVLLAKIVSSYERRKLKSIL
jgi:hypothetical protein